MWLQIQSEPKKTTSWSMAGPAKAKHQSTDYNATEYGAPSTVVQLLKRKSELQNGIGFLSRHEDCGINIHVLSH